MQRRDLDAQELAAYKDLVERHPNDGDLLGAVGLFYYHGRGTAKNCHEAMEWFERGAAAGSPRAAFFAAQALIQGGQWVQAREYLERSADRGFSPAVYGLGCLYEYGHGVEQDEQKAYSFFERAALAGHIFGQRQVAVRLLKGRAGLLGMLRGILMFSKLFILLSRIRLANPHDERILR